ncbi:MAG: RNA pseudouridine synthase [Gammaproteobacteria bacterium]|nr:MAG: RNA pseudouridine synthase [Gammaproteobacteria bacterium]
MDKIDILTIDESLQGMRLDLSILKARPAMTRSKIQSLIKTGYIACNNGQKKAKYITQINDTITIEQNYKNNPNSQYDAEDIQLNIVFEDENILIINKPVNMVVHPGVGNYHGTILNGLLYHYSQQKNVPRCGIVHRLDKDTTGLMMIARTQMAYDNLIEQLTNREISRKYQAIVQGEPICGDTVDLPIGRHHIDRQKFTIRNGGKFAITHFSVKQKYSGFTLLDIRLETGRTHQIRVHMSHIKLPILGDKTYGARLKLPKNCPTELATLLRSVQNQALHAYSLTLKNPTDGNIISLNIPLPDNMQQLINELEKTQI